VPYFAIMTGLRKPVENSGDAQLKDLAEGLSSKPNSAAASWPRFVALFLFLCALFILRKPDSLLNPQFWAEDGNLLFYDSIVEGGLAPVLHGYRGYLIVNSRLVAAFAVLFPAVYAPLIYNLAAIAISALACSLFALPWYRHLVHSDIIRAVTCVAAAGALSTGSLVGNLSNSQWYLALAAVVLLMRTSALPERIPLWQTSLCALVSLLAALTNPVLVVITPICLWYLVRRRNRAIAAAILVGVAVQVVSFALGSGGGSPPVAHNLAQLGHLAASVVIAIVYKVILASIAGSKTAAYISQAGAVGMFLCVLIASVAWSIWLCFRLDRGRRLHVAIAVYIATASVLLPLATRNGLSEAFANVAHIPEHGEQYFFLAACMLLFLIAVSLEWALRSWPERVSAGLLLVVVAGGFAGNFALPPFVDLHWRQNAPQIDAWRTARAHHELVDGFTVLVNPEPWAIHFPSCFQELIITGFPDRVIATPSSNPAAAFAILDSAIRSSADGIYIDLPTPLERHVFYRVRALIRTPGSSIVSLLVHGQFAGGSRTETTPVAVAGATYLLEAQMMTDDTMRLCIHIRHHSGAPVAIQSITITRL
jgi:hypothetical protein